MSEYAAVTGLTNGYPSVVDLLRTAGVPPRFLPARLATYTATSRPQQAALGFARQVASVPVAAPVAGGAIIGPVGTGKTHLAVGILAGRAEQWLAATPFPRVSRYHDRFVSVPQLMDAIGWWYMHPDAADPLEPAIAAPYLVLDDVGREKLTERAAERLYLLVDTRYGLERPTLITSNTPVAHLVEQGYDALLSRVCHGGTRIELPANTPDARRLGR